MNRHSHKLRILLLSLMCIGVLAGGTYAAYTKDCYPGILQAFHTFLA